MRYRKERYQYGSHENRILFDTVINISAEGLFYLYLPEEVLLKLEAAGIETLINPKSKKRGYYCGESIGDLNKNLTELFAKYFSKEIIEDKIVLSYHIETNCHYQITSDGDIVPNGYWNKDSSDWKDGTKSGTTTGEPYGFLVYIRPYRKVTFQYQDGEKKVEHKFIDEKEAEKLGQNLRWLRSLARMGTGYGSFRKVMEIDYNERRAKFFVDMIKAIANINEKIKQHLSPEAIAKLADNNVKLLQ